MANDVSLCIGCCQTGAEHVANLLWMDLATIVECAGKTCNGSSLNIGHI